MGLNLAKNRLTIRRFFGVLDIDRNRQLSRLNTQTNRTGTLFAEGGDGVIWFKGDSLMDVPRGDPMHFLERGEGMGKKIVSVSFDLHGTVRKIWRAAREG